MSPSFLLVQDLSTGLQRHPDADVKSVHISGNWTLTLESVIDAHTRQRQWIRLKRAPRGS